MAQGGPSNDAREKAAALFKQAEAYYRVQDYEKALEGYKQAYLLSLEPSLLFNMGQCYRQLGKYEEALKAYKSFLRDEPNNPLAAEVENLVKEVQAVIDQNKAVKDAAPVDPIKDPNPSTGPTSMVVIEGPNEGNNTNNPIEPPSEKSKAGMFYAGAAGAAGLGLLSGVLALTSGAKVRNLQRNGGSLQDVQSAFGRARLFAVAADVLVVAAVGVGGLGYITQQKEKKKTEASLSIAPTSISFTLRF